MNIFLSVFSKNIKSVYTCYDRVVIRGYILWMFSAGSLINFLRSKRFQKFSNGVMRIFTDQLNAHIEKEALRWKAPILWWKSIGGGKNGDKHEYVEKHYVEKLKKKGNFVYCIIADNEASYTYATRTLLTKDGKAYDKMYQCRKIVKHYYIYLHDQLLGGPCYLKLSTYFPFYVEFYFNGHNMVRLELEKKGIDYRMDGNALTMLENPKDVQRIVWSLSGKQVEERIKYWMNRFFRFDKGTYSTVIRDLKHNWYCSQIEICTNVIFKSARFCTNLFERLLDKFSRIGSPDSLSQIFSKRRTRKNTKSTLRLYDNKACAKYWFWSNAIKFYNKLGYYLRIETTINNPKLLGLKKPVIHLREYLSHGDKCNQRMLTCFADVDLKTIAEDEIDGLDRPIQTKKGQRVAAIDLRKKRQVALFEELLKPKYNVYGFKTRVLLENIPEFFQNLAQIRYEIRKLKERGLIEKKKGQLLYRVTEQGYKVLWVKCAWNLYFEEPIISASYKKSAKQLLTEPSKLESAYGQINEGLDLITKELSIKKAA